MDSRGGQKLLGLHCESIKKKYCYEFEGMPMEVLGLCFELIKKMPRNTGYFF